MNVWAPRSRDEGHRRQRHEYAGSDVDRIVHADEDPVNCYPDGTQNEQQTHPPVEDEDGEGNGEGDARMIARKRVVSRVVDEQYRRPWMTDERPSVVPKLGGDDVDSQRKHS